MKQYFLKRENEETMNYKYYDFLSPDVKMIREKVFIQEQGFENEFDETDKIAQHIVLYNEEMPIATCRIFKGDDDREYILGRLAVIREYRGKGLGSAMLKEAENLVIQNGGNTLTLHAQCRVKEFYVNLGYSEFGDVDYDEDCPHIWIRHMNLQRK